MACIAFQSALSVRKQTSSQQRGKKVEHVFETELPYFNNLLNVSYDVIIWLHHFAAWRRDL